MNDQQLTVREDMNVDRVKVNDLADRIAEFLPGSASVPKDTRLVMAQIALAHHFDPFIGDIWPIPERHKVNGEWVVTGYKIMIGITAWRRTAHETNEYWGRRFEKCTDEERRWLGASPNDLAIKCIVMRRKTGARPMEFDGFGIFKSGEPSKMNPLQCVRLRAERDALKGAFPIGFGGGNIKIAVADDTGEEINGDYPKWEIKGSEVTDHDKEPDTLDQLSEVVKRDAVSNAPIEQPKVEASAPDKTYRMAKVKFNGMTPDAWHTLCAEFAASHENWQKDSKPDMNHILSSAGKAGFEFITHDNIETMFTMIVERHAAKDAH